MTKHIVVTRLALKWRFNETKLNWENWLENSVHLMDNFCRKSLKNQTNQDFTLLSFVDESVEEYGNVLNNEIILKVKGRNNQYPKQEMITQINEYLKGIENLDSVILTRLDRDDCLHETFLGKVKNYLISNEESFIDLNYSLTYDFKNKTIHNSKKYFNTFVSPFVSTHETIKNNELRCISLLVDHDAVPKYLKGKKVDDLFAMQVIHENNLKNRIYGETININLKEYGI